MSSSHRDPRVVRQGNAPVAGGRVRRIGRPVRKSAIWSMPRRRPAPGMSAGWAHWRSRWVSARPWCRCRWWRSPIRRVGGSTDRIRAAVARRRRSRQGPLTEAREQRPVGSTNSCQHGRHCGQWGGFAFGCRVGCPGGALPVVRGGAAPAPATVVEPPAPNNADRNTATGPCKSASIGDGRGVQRRRGIGGRSRCTPGERVASGHNDPPATVVPLRASARNALSRVAATPPAAATSVVVPAPPGRAPAAAAAPAMTAAPTGGRCRGSVSGCWRAGRRWATGCSGAARWHTGPAAAARRDLIGRWISLKPSGVDDDGVAEVVGVGDPPKPSETGLLTATPLKISSGSHR